MNGAAMNEGAMNEGAVVIRRLHRLVRAGFRPWLGYDVAGGGDSDVQLRRRDAIASLAPDGTVTFDAPVASAGTDVRVIGGDDAAGFDAAFPANRPNRRNLVRRLYEIGVGAW